MTMARFSQWLRPVWIALVLINVVLSEDLTISDENEPDSLPETVETMSQTESTADERIAASDARLGGKLTWAITATTPVETPSGGPFQRDTNRLPPYVHWTCYHQDPSVVGKADRLQCCQTIYRLMERERHTLCWRKNMCGDKRDRADFLRACTTQIGSVPATPSTTMFSPTFSLVLAPEVEVMPESQWRQYLWLSHTDVGQWFYAVTSPIATAVDPLTFLQSSVEDDSLSWSVNLTSSIRSVTDDEDRLMEHVLVMDILADIDWAAQLTAVLFVPEEVFLLSKLVACETDCGATCLVHLAIDRQSSSATQEVMPLLVDLAGPPSTTCRVKFATRWSLEEDRLLAAPVIASGHLTAGETTRLYKASGGMATPLTTHLEYLGDGNQDEL